MSLLVVRVQVFEKLHYPLSIYLLLSQVKAARSINVIKFTTSFVKTYFENKPFFVNIT